MTFILSPVVMGNRGEQVTGDDDAGQSIAWIGPNVGNVGRSNATNDSTADDTLQLNVFDCVPDPSPALEHVATADRPSVSKVAVPV